MSETQLTSLGELVDLVADKVSGQKDANKPYVGLEQMGEGSPNLVGTLPASASVSVNSVFCRGDILFGKLRPNLKKCIQATFEGYCSTDILVLRARGGVFAGYAAKVFQWDAVFEAAVSTAEGTKMPRTSWDKLQHFRVVRQTPEEQRRIADILDAADAAIRQTEALVAKLRLMRTGLLHDLLTRGLDERGRLRDPVRHPEQFEDTLQGPKPKAWDLLSFGQLAEYINGGAFNENDWKTQGTPIIRIQNLNGGDDFNYFAGRINPRWEVQPGDLLFAWSGTRDTSFGPRLWRGPRGVLNQHIFKVVPVAERIVKDFLNELLSYHLPAITASAHGFKSSFVHVKREELTSVVVAVPQWDEQQRILAAIQAQTQRLTSEEAYLTKLKLQKRGLTSDLLTSRVRV